MKCITLLSDFGLQDASVAIAKGILMQHTNMPIMDISHEVTPFHNGQAAYLLAGAYKSFPAGSVHLVLCDVFSESTPRLVLSAHEGHFFLAPDNGIITLALGRVSSAWLCMELKKDGSFTNWLNEAGRIITRLKDRQPASLGLPDYQPQAIAASHAPIPGENGIHCEAVHIDNFENVVINITRQQYEAQRKGRNFRLQFMVVEEINELSDNYNDVRPGFKLCRFNSNNYLEICINRGKAASLFGLRLGGRLNDIKLFFE